MKNLVILSIILILFNCSEITITPNNIDKESTSSRKKNVFAVGVKPPYALSLRNANIYLTYDGIINFPDNEPYVDLNVKFLIITDGTKRTEPAQTWGTTIDEYEDATYIIVFALFSAPNSHAETGEFLSLSNGDLADVHPDGTKTIIYNEQTFNFGVVDRTNMLNVFNEVYPTTSGLAPTLCKDYLNVEGKLVGGERITLNFKSTFQQFGIFPDPEDPSFKTAEGYIHVSGIIDSRYLKTGETQARKAK